MGVQDTLTILEHENLGLRSEEVAVTKPMSHLYVLDLETCQVRRQSGVLPCAESPQTQSLRIGNTKIDATIPSVEAKAETASLAWTLEGCLEWWGN